MLLKAVTWKTLINMGETSTYSPDSAILYKIILGLDACSSEFSNLMNTKKTHLSFLPQTIKRRNPETSSVVGTGT